MTMRRVNSRRLGIAFGLVGLLIVRPLPTASKCVNLTISQLLENSSVVFTGEAVEAKPLGGFLEIRFKQRGIQRNKRRQRDTSACLFTWLRTAD
jgi:hypothetical protein